MDWSKFERPDTIAEHNIREECEEKEILLECKISKLKIDLANLEAQHRELDELWDRTAQKNTLLESILIEAMGYIQNEAMLEEIREALDEV